MSTTLEDISERYDRMYPAYKRAVKENYRSNKHWNAYDQKEEALQRVRSLKRKLQKVALDET